MDIITKEKNDTIKEIYDLQESIPSIRLKAIEKMELAEALRASSAGIGLNDNLIEKAKYYGQERAYIRGIDTYQSYNLGTASENTRQANLTYPREHTFGAIFTDPNDITDYKTVSNTEAQNDELFITVDKATNLMATTNNYKAFTLPEKQVQSTTFPIQEYNSSVTYNKGDCVVYDGKAYICISTTTGSFDPSKWVLYDGNIVTNGYIYSVENPDPIEDTPIIVDGYVYDITLEKPFEQGTFELYANTQRVVYQDANFNLVSDVVNIKAFSIDLEANNIYMILQQQFTGDYLNVKYTVNEMISRLPEYGKRENYKHALKGYPDRNTIKVYIKNYNNTGNNVLIGTESNGVISGTGMLNSTINYDLGTFDINLTNLPVTGDEIYIEYTITESLGIVPYNKPNYQDSVNSYLFPNSFRFYVDEILIASDNGSGNFNDNIYINGNQSTINYLTGAFNIVVKEPFYSLSGKIRIEYQNIYDEADFLNQYTKAQITITTKNYLSYTLTIVTIPSSIPIQEQPDLYDILPVRDKYYNTRYNIIVFAEGLKLNESFDPINGDPVTCMEVNDSDFRSLFGFINNNTDISKSLSNTSTYEEPELNPFYPFGVIPADYVVHSSIPNYATNTNYNVGDQVKVLQSNGGYKYYECIFAYNSGSASTINTEYWISVLYDPDWVGEIPYIGNTPNTINYLILDSSNTPIYQVLSGLKWNYQSTPNNSNAFSYGNNRYLVGGCESMRDLTLATLTIPADSESVIYTMNNGFVYRNGEYFDCAYNQIKDLYNRLLLNGFNYAQRIVNLSKTNWNNSTEDNNFITSTNTYISAYNTFFTYFNGFAPLLRQPLNSTNINNYKSACGTYVTALNTRLNYINNIMGDARTSGYTNQIYKAVSLAVDKNYGYERNVFKYLDNTEQLYDIMSDKQDYYKLLP